MKEIMKRSWMLQGASSLRLQVRGIESDERRMQSAKFPCPEVPR